jgi:hypothetical protein
MSEISLENNGFRYALNLGSSRWSIKSREKTKSMDGILGGSLFEDFDKVFEKFENGEGRGSGYSISGSQTSQGTSRKKHGCECLRKATSAAISRRPNRDMGRQPLIREISTKPVKEEDEKEEDREKL